MPKDAELLTEYLAGNHEAFAALVHRHAGMVYGVSLRILRSRHDAEDAFQATFLVLARKADDIRPAGQVARWLYGVARHVAMKARQYRERRRSIEALAGQARSAGAETEIPENLWRVLDEEAARLPGHLLTPFLLCDLEGLTYREAAQQLGLPEGTLSNRLATARRKLAVLLTRRGIVLPAAGLATVLSSSTVEAAPPDLIASTAEAASSADMLTPLAEGVIRNMAITKVTRAAIAVVMVLALASAGWAFLADRIGDPEAKALEGEWSVTRAEQGGKQMPDEDVKKMKVTIKAGMMTIDTGTRQESVTMSIDATTKPKGIDLRRVKGGNEQVDHGIYELDGDELKICWGEEKTADRRPEEFKTTKDLGGRLLILKRTKAKRE